MNNREAIVRIREVINFTESIDSCSDEDMQDVKALRMAIKALEQTEKTEEMIYMLLNEADVEANTLKDSKMMYDIGYRDGIKFIAHKLEALMKL